jgi:isopenicillin N synthase-like dioxygenase
MFVDGLGPPGRILAGSSGQYSRTVAQKLAAASDPPLLASAPPRSIDPFANPHVAGKARQGHHATRQADDVSWTGMMGSDSAAGGSIPVIDVAGVFDADAGLWAAVDRALWAAAREIGFACIRGLPGEAVPGPAARARLLSIFGLSEAEKRRLYRRKFAPANPNVYRGWFALQPGNLTSKEGIDLGGDIVHGAAITVPGDPLREATPLPDDDRLPRWRPAVAAHYRVMERVAGVLMRSLARSLGLRAEYFDQAFRCGLSTLRLIRYPPREAAELARVSDPAVWVDEPPARRHLVGAPHTDSGFLTLLAQDGVGGLQARARDGRWIDVPPLEGTLVVNFGQVLERWSGGRIRATEHRVLGSGLERYSIPFFYEARADAMVAPLPIDPSDLFVPFPYGEFLWNRITSFVEFRGLEAQRPGDFDARAS